MVFDVTFSTIDHMRKVTVPVNWKNLVEEHSDLAMQANFTHSKKWHIKKISIMPLPSDAWEEDSMESGTQVLPPGYDPRAAPSGIT